MRRWTKSIMVTAALIGAAAGGGAEASYTGERLVMPFSCAVQGQTLAVSPSAPRYYEIVGRRRVERVSTCVEGRGCGVLEVQAFDVACDGGRVAWSDIAAIGAPLLGGGVRMRDGVMLLQFRGRLRPWPGARCLKGDWPHRGAPLASVESPFPDVGCEAVGGFEPSEPHIEVPRGFAPLSELGARTFEIAAPAEPGAAVRLTGHVPLPERPADGLRFASLATPLPPIGASAGVESAPEPVAGANATQTAPPPWLTLIEIRTPASSEPGDAQRGLERSVMAVMLGLTLVAGLVSGFGWFVTARSRAPFRPADAYEVILRRDGVDLTRPEAQLCGDLCRSAQGLVGQVHAVIDDLQGVAPLRRTLLREIRDLEHYLATLIAAVPNDPTEWKRMRAKLQRVVNDILRLKDIVESAQRSLSAAPANRGLPRDKAEAFESLGANPTTSEKILKKLVDALRATWHPDLAVDDEDRRAREERIKQINVAWDLICERRVEA